MRTRGVIKTQERDRVVVRVTVKIDVSEFFYDMYLTYKKIGCLFFTKDKRG